jgi:hypothetical protein
MKREYSTISDNLDVLLKAEFTRICDYNMETIHSYLEKQNIIPLKHLSDAIREYLRFMCLKREIKDYEPSIAGLSPSPMIDKVWHAHILHTKHYQEFCVACFPKNKFCHRDVEESDTFQNAERYYRTLALYCKTFHSDPLVNAVWKPEIINSSNNNNFYHFLSEATRNIIGMSVKIPEDGNIRLIIFGLDGSQLQYTAKKTTTVQEMKDDAAAAYAIPEASFFLVSPYRTIPKQGRVKDVGFQAYEELHMIRYQLGC